MVHTGRPRIDKSTGVNPAISHASTLLFKSAADLYSNKYKNYGRWGCEIHEILENMFADLEGGKGCTPTPSGLAANTLSILSCVETGDHVLVTDSVYNPVRHFATTFLKRMGVEAEFYPPGAGAKIEKYIKPNTSVILTESPGSLTMEIQDLPEIARTAKKNKIIVIADNTWSAGLVYNPLLWGADMVVHSATKYFGGHSDLLLGAIVSRTTTLANKVKYTAKALGNATAPDDVYQVLRGFRTVTTRFEKQAQTALELANWFKSRSEIVQVLHPALKSYPDHRIWKRDFTGAASLFSIVLNPCSEREVIKFLDRLKYFGKGFSFGGYESLIIHCGPQLNRIFPCAYGGPLVRIACGLEDVDDLRTDLENSLERIKFL